MTYNNEILREIMAVWEGYDDFDSNDYVGFVIEREAREIRDSDWKDAEKEFADIAICALRMLAENSDDPRGVILNRLSERMDGKQEDIIQTYKAEYDATTDYSPKTH